MPNEKEEEQGSIDQKDVGEKTRRNSQLQLQEAEK